MQKAYTWSASTATWVSTVCHPHTLTQDPERLLQGELEDMETAADEEPPEDAPVSDPEKVQAPA